MTIHDMAPFDVPASFSPKYRAVAQQLLRTLSASATEIIVPSEFTASRLFEHLTPKAPVSVIRHGWSWAQAQPLRRAAPEAPFVLAVGSSDPRKRQHMLYEAWHRVRRSLPGWKLKIVGGQDARIFGSAGGAAQEGVQHLGRIDDSQLADLLRTARVFVSCSSYEGYDLPAAEAIAAGCPVVLSDIPIHRELFEGHAKFFSTTTELGDALQAVDSLPTPVQTSSWPTWSASAAAHDALLRRYL